MRETFNYIDIFTNVPIAKLSERSDTERLRWFYNRRETLKKAERLVNHFEKNAFVMRAQNAPEYKKALANPLLLEACSLQDIKSTEPSIAELMEKEEITSSRVYRAKKLIERTKASLSLVRL